MKKLTLSLIVLITIAFLLLFESCATSVHVQTDGTVYYIEDHNGDVIDWSVDSVKLVKRNR